MILIPTTLSTTVSLLIYTHQNHPHTPVLMASKESDHLLHWHFTDLSRSSFPINGRGLAFLLVSFSVIILAVFFVYVRSVCFARRVSTTSTEDHAISSTAPRPSRLSGLDAATIDSFPIFLHRSSASSGSEQSECSICLVDFRDEEKLKVLPECLHAYHSECVDKWLTQQSSCPLCRASLIPVDSPV